MGYIEDFAEIMELEREVLTEMIAATVGDCAGELTLLGVDLPEVGCIPRVTFAEAKAALERIGIPDEEDDLSPEEEAGLGAYARDARR